MKKFLIALLIICIFPLASLAEGLDVVVTSFPPYDFVRAVAGDRASVKMLIKPGAETHIYEPTPQDIMAIDRCDLFVLGGGESDEWAENLLSATGGDRRVTLRMMDMVPLLHEEDDEQEYDEHVWTSPANAALIVNEIRDALCRLDPEGAEVYTANAAAYVRQIDEVDQAFHQVVAQESRNVIIFADRFPLIYFAHQYGIDYIAAFPGCATETEPSAAKMAELIKGAMESGAPVVLYLDLSNGAIAKAVAEQTGKDTAVFYACHNVTQEDLDAGLTYVDYMLRNVDTLRAALCD